MKTIHICYSNGSISVVRAPIGSSLQAIAEEYPAANIYWVCAPLTLPMSERCVLRRTNKNATDYDAHHASLLTA